MKEEIITKYVVLSPIIETGVKWYPVVMQYPFRLGLRPYSPPIEYFRTKEEADSYCLSKNEELVGGLK